MFPGHRLNHSSRIQADKYPVLKETLLYPIYHSDIKKMLNIALPDKSIDDWSKVEKLVKFVSDYIEDDYVSNSSSAFISVV